MHLTLRAALLATIAAAAPVPGFAADVTPEQAAKLEGQLRDWFQGMAGPGAPVPTSPIQVTAEGDHFRLASPSAGMKMPVQGWPTALANARPLDGGRWALDGIHLQTPAKFTVDMPVPVSNEDAPDTKPDVKPGARPGTRPGANPGAKPAAKPTATATVPTTYTLTYAEQDGSGTWDPTFATPSVINTRSSGTQLTVENTFSQQATKIERTSATTTLRPATDGRVDASTEVNAEGYSLATMVKGANAPALNVQAYARQAKVGLSLLGVSREQMGRLVPALVKFAPAPGTPAPDGKAPPNPEGVRMLIEALQGFASGMAMTEVLDDFKVSSQGVSFTTSQIRFGMDAKADAGLMSAAMDIGVDGIALPGMGLDAFASLLPQKVALRPVVSQVPTKEFLQLLQTAMLKPNDGPPPAEVAALFSHGGLKGGIESFTLDMGGASFSGTASVVIPDPNTVSGTGQVVGTNVDALMTALQGNPVLAQGVPVLALAKGMGRSEGNRTVWDMVFRDGKLLVNGVDLSKMGGR